jgi:hypothetical protein
MEPHLCDEARLRSVQQLQFLQVQGLHLQPLRVSSLAAWACCSVWLVMTYLLARGSGLAHIATVP